MWNNVDINMNQWFDTSFNLTTQMRPRTCVFRTKCINLKHASHMYLYIYMLHEKYRRSQESPRCISARLVSVCFMLMSSLPDRRMECWNLSEAHIALIFAQYTLPILRPSAGIWWKMEVQESLESKAHGKTKQNVRARSISIFLALWWETFCTSVVPTGDCDTTAGAYHHPLASPAASCQLKWIRITSIYLHS